jgi:antitoxin Phd
MEASMGNQWTLQDAKNKFSSVVDAAEKGVPQHVGKRGPQAVVVVSAAEYHRLTNLESKPAKSLREHLLDFPQLPAGMDDVFDDRDQYLSTPREISFD